MILNIPNALSAFRLLGSLTLLGLTAAGQERGFAWLLGGLLVSDWIDGKLAIAWRQQTTFGARLDSIADYAMYSAMLVGMAQFHQPLFWGHRWWLAAVAATFVMSSGLGWWKYGRLPSYHTRAAKTSWLLVSLAVLVVFAHGPEWPIRLAAAVVVFTNLETTLMTLLLPEWHADVPSIWHALQKRSRT